MAQTEYQKQYYEQNKDRITQRAVQWQLDNRAAHNKTVAEYSKRNPEVGREANRRYREKHKGTLLFSQKSMLNRVRSRAKKCNINFDLTLEYIQSIWPADNKCPVYGCVFDLEGIDLQSCASIDKIDPTKGYIQGNVMIISFRANSLKKDSTLDELKVLVEFLERISS